MSENKNTERIILPDRIEGELNLESLNKDIELSGFKLPDRIEGELNLDDVVSERKSINTDVVAKMLEDVRIEDLQQIREGLKSTVSPENPNFLIHQEDLRGISLPNLKQYGINFLNNNEKIQGELYLASIEDHDKVTDALTSAGIDIKEFFFGTPSGDEIKKAYEVVEAVGIDPKKYFAGYPHLADFDIDLESKGRRI